MKKLYIRFFNHKDDTIPVNSECMGTYEGFVAVPMASEEVAYTISVWMVEHVEGKVDFVWL